MQQVFRRRAPSSARRAHHLRRGRLWSLVVVALGAAVFASAAAADTPTRTQYTSTFTTVLTDVCSFPIALDSSANITETDFVNSSGDLTRVLVHVVEQDTFNANGNSLTGTPFTFNLDVRFDSGGVVTHVFANGIVEKVPLPDGSLFITSGRVDFAAHGFPLFLITPDVGATVNLAGFCAALSP